MGALFNFLNNITPNINALISTILTAIESLAEIPITLNNITFDSTNPVYVFFSTFRYLVGDVLYLMMTSLIILGMSLLLFKIVKKGVNAILSFVPGFNIRLP